MTITITNGWMPKIGMMFPRIVMTEEDGMTLIPWHHHRQPRLYENDKHVIIKIGDNHRHPHDHAIFDDPTITKIITMDLDEEGATAATITAEGEIPKQAPLIGKRKLISKPWRALVMIICTVWHLCTMHYEPRNEHLFLSKVAS